MNIEARIKMATDKETASLYMRNMYRYSTAITAITVLFLLASFFWLAASSGSSNLFPSLALYLIGIGLSMLLALDIIRRSRLSPIQMSFDKRYQTAWMLIALALLAAGPGGLFAPLLCQAMWTLNAPALAYLSVISVFFYPLIFVGLLFISGTGRWRIGLIFDVFITILCIVSLCWFILSSGTAPDYPSGDLLIRTIVLSYPGNDVFLLYALIPLIRQEKEIRLRVPLYMLGGAFIVNLWAHSAAAYVYLTTNRYIFGTVYIDWFWLVSFALLGLAVLYQYTALVRKTYQEHTKLAGQPQGLTPPEGIFLRPEQYLPGGWRAIRILYIPLVLIICFLLITNALTKNSEVSGFVILCALTGGVISVRYFYSSRVNDLLIRERDQRYSETEHVRHLVEQLSDIRDLEFLRERIVSVLLNHLGFTFAMLLLVEEYDGERFNQSHLLVSMASKSVHLTKWRLRADSNILLSTATSGKRTEINWDNYHNLPAEIRNWQTKHKLPSMVFFPITNRDKVLGSLGVAQHALGQHSRSEMTIIRQYTDQIAPILEHGYLYRQARERENFARAMANIATRLNAVVVDLKEISQSICEEGANALNADYVVLYLANDDSTLTPLAASSGEDRSVSAPHHWPPFTLNDYRDETSNSLHPFLLDITQRHKMQASSENDAFFGINTLTETMAREYFGPRLFALRTLLARRFIQTVILAPLVHGGQIQGVVLFGRASPPGHSNDRSFEFSDLPHTQDFVEQAGVAFSNARLYGSLQETHKRLQELDQLKDQFMITASHELRTPLTAVQGYIELIAQYNDILPPEQRREFLQKAQLGCEELAVLLRNVMDASRLEAEAGIKPALISRVNVLEIIEKVNVMIEPMVTHEQRQVTIDAPPYLSVSADPLRLHQVLMNISSNALKYSPAGSPLSFSARISPDQARSVTISIADKGKGIALADQAQLFQRFVRLERDLNSPVRGSGLGLYISRRLIEAMGGKIWIESRGIAGEGSTFHIQLPMA